MGRATAEVYAAEGARVAVMARGQQELDATETRLQELGALDVLALKADLREASSIQQAIGRLGERWGVLNVLVNAAGPTEVGVASFENLDDEEWQATFDIGTLSAVRCVRAALPLMRAAVTSPGGWARIINLSAHSTQRQSAGLVAYTAAKAALTSLSKNLSLSLAPDGILVNTISPGSFASPALKGYVAALPPERNADPESLEDIMRIIKEDFGHPAHLPRAGDPSEIANVIAFVGSKANTYMTGADINVDGGSDFT
jgi:3-oxoacyl-[acyl-carrier protein] reductase